LNGLPKLHLRFHVSTQCTVQPLFNNSD